MVRNFEKGKENCDVQEHQQLNNEVHEDREQFVHKGGPKGGRGLQSRPEEQTKASTANNVRGVTKTRGIISLFLIFNGAQFQFIMIPTSLATIFMYFFPIIRITMSNF